MNEATVIYPHQLSAEHPALRPERPVYLVEESLILTHNPIHRQKLMFHKLTLDAYQAFLTEAGYQVTRVTISDCPDTAAVFKKLRVDGVERMHIADTTDNYLEQAILTSNIERVWYASPLFILEKEEAIARYTSSKRLMATFYKKLRQDKNVLLEDDGSPVSGQWSFDEDNRKKIPKHTKLPEDIQQYGNEATVAAEQWAEGVPAEQYGEASCWLPYTHDGAKKFLNDFLETRFATFGPYEDAMTTNGVRLWHSALSALLNVGLLTPHHVLDAAITYAQKESVPINSLEGFVRQVLGWREFIRASYECDGSAMRSTNFFKHTKSLPDSFWTGETSLAPVNHVISTALSYGYTHHIERLMVMGNVMLLSKVHPNEVYRWFMGMYVDAYDWVMVPNVYGMSQFADGGSFATKPYISGSNYIKKMSDFPSGDWEDTWTALYWNFIAEHSDLFANNHRMSMMPHMYNRLSDEKKQHYKKLAKEYFSQQT